MQWPISGVCLCPHVFRMLILMKASNAINRVKDVGAGAEVHNIYSETALQ